MNEIIIFFIGAAIPVYFLKSRFVIRRSEVIMPPMVMGHVVFSLNYLILLLIHPKATHIIWIYPTSLIIGIVMTGIPLFQSMLMNFLALLSYPGVVDNDQL